VRPPNGIEYKGSMRTLDAIVALLLMVEPGLVAPAGTETDLGGRVQVRPLSARAWLIRSVSPLEGFGDVDSNAVLSRAPGHRC
jgi:metallo-beta-lactamase class B